MFDRRSRWEAAHPLHAVALSLILITGGCDRIQQFFAGRLAGDVFIRTNSGDTKPQGGLELRLVDPTALSELDSFNRRFDERIADLKTQFDAYDQLKKTLSDQVMAWRRAVAAEITLAPTAARSSLARDWAELRIAVHNRSSYRVSSVRFALFCGDSAIPARLSIDDNLFFGQLAPEKQVISNELVQDRERAEQVTKCRKDQLRAEVVEFFIVDPTNGRSYNSTSKLLCELDFTEHCPNPPTQQTGVRLQEAANRLRATLKTGVQDLDAEVENAVQSHTRHTARSDINGRYSFDQLSAGPFVLSAWYTSSVDDTGWFVPVDIRRGNQRQDLSNFNLSDPRFASRWKKAVVKVVIDSAISGAAGTSSLD